MRIADLVNQEIQITGYSIDRSKFTNADGDKKDRLTLEFLLDGEKHIAFTSSGVLIAQIVKYQDMIPFITTIKYINRYYTFS
jgi:hypothetical protein